MRIMSYNIFEGGMGRLDPLYEVIRAENPDVILVQETWETAIFEKLAIKLGMEIFQAQNPRNSRGNVGILSRFPIRRAINFGPMDSRLTRAAALATVNGPNFSVSLLCVHLHPYPTPADEAIRLREMEAILDIARNNPAESEGVIIGGDFNSVHPDQPIDTAQLDPKNYQRMMAHGGSAPRQVVKKILENGWLDAHAATRDPAGWDTTFTTAYPAMRVDYLFVPNPMASRVAGCRVVKSPMARFASDHFPIVLDLRQAAR